METSPSLKKGRLTLPQILNYAIGGLLAVGLVLSVLSAFHVCSSACAEGHKYRILGFAFETLGIAFFVFTIAAYLLGQRWPLFTTIAALSVAGAIGAETYFLYVQKYIIGKWCPLCVTIACTVGIIGVLCLIQYLLSGDRATTDQERRTHMLQKILGGMTSIAIGLVGFTVALFGIAKVEHSFADTNARGESPVFGNAKSPVEVYLFTDWFCPACRKTEPAIEKALPAIMAKARVFFIDVPIHEDSLNYLPYNLSFMLKEKGKYLQLRRALTALAEKDSSPSEADVAALAKKYGVTYHQLDFAEVNQGLKYFKKMTDKYSVDATPTVVITNPSTKKAKKLEGYNQITEANIPHIIDQLK